MKQTWRHGADLLLLSLPKVLPALATVRQSDSQTHMLLLQAPRALHKNMRVCCCCRCCSSSVLASPSSSPSLMQKHGIRVSCSFLSLLLLLLLLLHYFILDPIKIAFLYIYDILRGSFCGCSCCSCCCCFLPLYAWRTTGADAAPLKPLLSLLFPQTHSHTHPHDLSIFSCHTPSTSSPL